MRYWICFIFLLLAIPTQTEAGIRRWDALPAVDVMHLQGPYAGRNVCPICQHGYDAGVLMFLPSTTTPVNASRIARALQATVSKVDDTRFRPFLILTGEAPSKELLAAVKSSHSNWYVAHLPTQALTVASRDFKLSLAGQSHAFVFAQRRLLWTFVPQDSSSSWLSELPKYADYAMTFLRSTYANPVASNNPDTPKGRLWTAPAKLSEKIIFTESSKQGVTRVCFSDQTRTRQLDALVALTSTGSASPKRAWWARTDHNGCLSLVRPHQAMQLHVEVFRALRAVVTAGIDTRSFQPDKHLEISLQSAGVIAVTGKEPVVGLPCDGCEAVFKWMPDRFSTSARLVPTSEPGEPLLISGTVKNSADIPQANVIVYAYQTDRRGSYPLGLTRHGRLRGWVRTGLDGKYSFNTIRPGSYPGKDIPQHIHMHIIEPNRCTYTVGDILFADDPLLTAAHRSKERNARGGSGIVHLAGNKKIGWQATRDITLGLNVPGYSACS